MPSRAARSPWKIATRILFVALLALILRTFGDYGMSWDQEYRLTEGGKKLNYYENLFSGHYRPYDNPEDLYPGFYDLLVQVVNLAHPCGTGILGLVYTDHLMSALFGLLAIVAAWKIGKRLGDNKSSPHSGPRAGFFAALFLAAFPHFYGHLFINPKDIPFACLYLWSLYYTLKLLDAKLDWKLLTKLTLAYGLTLAVRMGGIFFFGYMFLALAGRLFLKRQELTPAKLSARALRYVGLIALVGLAAFALLLPFWPYAHPNPVGAILHALGKVANYPWNGPVVINGLAYAATDLPWYYLPEMLLITTPEFLVALGLLGIGLAAWSLWRKAPHEKLAYLTPSRLGIFFIAFSFLFPVVAVIVKHATLYDGIRHFLFSLGPWAILSALAFSKALNLLSDALRARPTPALYGLRTLLVAGVFAGVFLVARENRLMHPYQYVYFNSFVGNTDKAWARFDTEYWGTSHKEAVELLAAHLARASDTKTYKVNSPMAPWLTEYFLPKNLVYTNDPRQADFFISFLRYNAQNWSDGEIMEDCIVMRKGDIPLALVRDRRQIIAEQKAALQKGRPSAHFVSGILDILTGI